MIMMLNDDNDSGMTLACQRPALDRIVDVWPTGCHFTDTA